MSWSSVGSFCIDKYEASVWDSPERAAPNSRTEAQIDAACPNNGQPTVWAPCTAFYARSVPGVEPARRHHLVPGPAGARQLRQAVADQRRVAGGGLRDARTPQRAATCSTRDVGSPTPAPTPAASRASAPSTWSETSSSGSATGCRARRRLRNLELQRRLTSASAGGATTGEPGALIRGGGFSFARRGRRAVRGQRQLPAVGLVQSATPGSAARASRPAIWCTGRDSPRSRRAERVGRSIPLRTRSGSALHVCRQHHQLVLRLHPRIVDGGGLPIPQEAPSVFRPLRSPCRAQNAAFHIVPSRRTLRRLDDLKPHAAAQENARGPRASPRASQTH